MFTNGVFDLLHRGHVEYLADARALGDRLVVGVNSDASTRRLKGPPRPLLPEAERMEVLAALESVDLVVSFDADTPAALIEAVRPDVLVKGRITSYNVCYTKLLRATRDRATSCANLAGYDGRQAAGREPFSSYNFV